MKTVGTLVFLLLSNTVIIHAQQKEAIPSPPIRVFQADSRQERAALNEPFVGVTSDGTKRKGLYKIESTGVGTLAIKTAVDEFLAALSPEQRRACTFPIRDKEWRRWTNIDVSLYTRKGIALKDLSDNQEQLAFEVLATSLSAQGLKKTKDIMAMEEYLAYLAKDDESLSNDLYWFTFMGTPSETEPWGWQLDGHHLVINYFILGDQVVMTPTFMGSEPNHIPDPRDGGVHTFQNEERLGITLYQSFTPEQKAKATLSTQKNTSFNQTESFRDNAVVPYSGLSVADLSKSQVAHLKALIHEYVGNMLEGHAEIKMAEVDNYLDETYFAWIGKTDASGPFYYRIQSPVILIEFDHQKPNFLKGNKPSKEHVHTVIRTPNGNDYGKDLLRQHLEKYQH